MKGHTHRCVRCETPFACAGEQVRNFDGFPETICELFHQDGRSVFQECDTCLMTTWCEYCGKHPAKVEHDGDRLCLTCADEQLPGFQWYRLPDGRVVPVDATASKDARLIEFTLEDGQIVDAIQVG